jgi:hypothetical protein
MRTSLRSGSGTALLLAVVGCGSSLPTQNREMTSAVVGTTGGMVASSDGTLQVAIPAGALAGSVTVTIVPTASPGTGSVGTVYEIGPTGTQFAIPVTLTFDYSATNISGTDPSMLRVATYAAGSWEILSGAAVDMQAQMVSGTTMHLSPYGIVSASTGAMCATVSGSVSCSGNVSGGSSTGSGGVATSGGTNSGSGGASGAAAAGGSTNSGDTVCTPSSCADATNACAAYPGATMSSCTDGPNGYQATCCFPLGGSICLAAAGAGGGCTEDCSVNGPCTTTCPPAPTCGSATTASACGSLVGATLQDCVDGTSGYTAACCFAPGAPVCTTVTPSVACGGSTTGVTTCAPAPTCASGNPCSGIAGATMTSCTDTANGYSAVCCLPAGEVPSMGDQQSSTGGGVGGAGGADTGTAGTTGAGSGTAGSGGASATGAGGTVESGAGGGTGSGTGIGGASGTDGTSTGAGGTTGSGTGIGGTSGTDGTSTGAGGTTGGGAGAFV